MGPNLLLTSSGCKGLLHANVRKRALACAFLAPGLLAVVLTWLLTVGLPAHAQQGGAPPWPILFEGEAYAGGELVASGTLTVRVGDWESDPAQVANGVFPCCLMAGPPSKAYVGLPVTFHLDGERVAGYTFDFPDMDTPDRRSIELTFPEAPNEGAAGVVIVLAVAGLLVAGGAGYAVRRRGRRPAAGRRRP